MSERLKKDQAVGEAPARDNPALRIIALEQAVKSMEGRNFSHPGSSAVAIAEIMLPFLEGKETAPNE